MFNLTSQERSVILFFIAVALTGAGINLAVKVNSKVTQVVRIEDNFTRLNLNRAGYEDLSGALGLSPLLAERIIAYRNAHGSFGGLEELKNIKGIGESRYEKLKDLFFVD